MRFTWSHRFKKHFKARANENLQQAYHERLKLFISNPFNPILHNHSLKGELKGKRSINITGDYRLIFEEVGSDTYLLHDFGTHDQLYKS